MKSFVLTRLLRVWPQAWLKSLRRIAKRECCLSLGGHDWAPPTLDVRDHALTRFYTATSECRGFCGQQIAVTLGLTRREMVAASSPDDLVAFTKARLNRDLMRAMGLPTEGPLS